MNVRETMREAGVVIGKAGEPIFWHLPPGRTSGAIPDTRLLWDVLWDRREFIAGFAHSHPGSGVPCPSSTDLSTFAAIESALGTRLQWWITSSNRLIRCAYAVDASPCYQGVLEHNEPAWAEELRNVSSNSSVLYS